MAGINMVKVFFLKGTTPKTRYDLQKITTLAYQTAREHKLYPKEILVRWESFDCLHMKFQAAADLYESSGAAHYTTTIGGKYAPDPYGSHFTFCYKDEDQVRRGTHIACHGYTPSPHDYTLTRTTITPEKSDNTLKKRNKKPVWPGVAELEVGPEIGYHHEKPETSDNRQADVCTHLDFVSVLTPRLV